MKLNKSYAAAIAAVLFMGTISATTFADGNNIMLRPVGGEENTDSNSGEDNNSSLPDEGSPVFPLKPVTDSDDSNSDTSEANSDTSDKGTSKPNGSDTNDNTDDTPKTNIPNTNDNRTDDTPEINGDTENKETPKTNTPDTDDNNTDDTPKTDDAPADNGTSAPDSSGSDDDDNNGDETPKINAVPIDKETASSGVSDTSADVVPVSSSSEITADGASVSETSVADTNTDTEIRLGETISVKSEVLNGEVKVLTDKDDTALEGARLAVAALDKAKAAEKLSAAANNGFKEISDAAVKAVENGNAVALDIGFNKNGNDVSPAKDVTVTVPVPMNLKDAEDLFVYHVTDKELEDVTAKCAYNKDNGTIAITNNAFSPYIISKVRIKAKAAAGGEPELTAYNDNFSTGVALAVAPIVVAGAFVAVIAVKRKR